MTATNGMISREFEDYVDAWAEMMITIWKEKMAALDIGNTGALRSSLRTEVVRQAGGNATKINHFFLHYGHYVAGGTGKGYERGNGGYLDFTPQREKKPWLSGKYWYSKNRLLLEMLEQTGIYYQASLSAILTG
jgi:hypothetical protein